MKVTATPKTKIPFYLHDLGAPELDSIRQVLEGPMLTTGETVALFEKRFASYFGRRFALGVTSCTGAMHLSFLALGIGPGDEVITTPMTFIATATAILEAGARPVFVDVEPDTGNLDSSRVADAVTKRTKAILPVHLYGLMCDMRGLREVAERHGLHLIEDSSHCVEGEREAVRPGGLSDTACFSFYATKSLTCGEGGALVTDRQDLYEHMRLLRLHGMNKSASDREREGYQHWDVEIMGWKYNMDNIQAAMLLPQIDRLQANLERRRQIAQQYEEGLQNIPGLEWPAGRPAALHARHLFPVWVAPSHRDRVIQELKKEGIDVMVNYRPVHLVSYFKNQFGYRRGGFPHAERIGERTISLPLYPQMPDEHVERVIQTLKRILESHS